MQNFILRFILSFIYVTLKHFYNPNYVILMIVMVLNQITEKVKETIQRKLIFHFEKRLDYFFIS